MWLNWRDVIEPPEADEPSCEEKLERLSCLEDYYYEVAMEEGL